MTTLILPDWLQQVFDQLPISLFCRDPEGRYLFCNLTFARQAGFATPDDLVGRYDHELPWGDRYRDEDRRLLAHGAPLIGQQTRCQEGGQECWINSHKLPLFGTQGEALAVLGMVEEITHFKGVEEALSLHQHLLRRVLDAIPDLISLTREDGQLVECNHALLQFLGAHREDLPLPLAGHPLHELPAAEVEISLKDAVGRLHQLAVTRLCVPGLGEPALLTLYRDVTGLRSTQKQLKRAHHFDSLTGLMKLSTLLEQTQRLPRQAVGLVMLDVQHFREINDRFGIRVADQLLSQIAVRLQQLAPREALIGRLAADDFCLLLPLHHLTLPLASWVKALHRQLLPPYQVQDHLIQIECHLGYAEGESSEAELLLGHAEAALAQAKRERITCHPFDPQLAARIRRSRHLEQALPVAIRQERLHLVYQPIMGAPRGELLGTEVLCRWHDDELGPISPDEFIPLAESLGLIGVLGLQVMRRACAQLARWQPHHPGLLLSVNLSPLQFRHPGLCLELCRIIDECGLSTGRVELEITESVLMENAEEIDSNLRQLLAAGFSLAIDDFGTGYCSLAYLSRLKVHNLKLDRSFIRELESNPTTTAIVRSVIGLAQELGIQITAEGVETEAQHGWLVAAGCQRLQGYLFSPPLPPIQFAERFLTLAKNQEAAQ
ncbi:EAL domain-containing protein [Aeromonas schubertii]|uniref:EAL domain-containing protein n=1 Tax=Aeromonas schubertii TaxID=652 RepID=A0ABS7VFI3_9GAMM|nr:EAL domain-containing protein [Aeromonas schubertii]MBZ6068150.1 EAL domain-containing protein [Aeromonas schubertii]MBZ6073840.1 EAL domain-containing protein [Aeromonas schubertii]